MTDEEKSILNKFEAHVRVLMEKYAQLEDRNKELLSLLDAKKGEIEKLNEEKMVLTKKYQNLKTARMIQISDNDMKNAKQRLSRLVREVDKCIAMLTTENID